MQDDAGDALNNVGDDHPVCVVNAGYFINDDGHQQHAFVKHVIVPDELRQRERHAVR